MNGRSETRAAVRDWTLQAALLVLLVLTHELLRAPHVRLHFVTVPLLAIPVAYFSTVLGARGAALSAILTGVLLAMHRNDWHAEVIALEIGLLASISFLGAAMAAVAGRDRVLDKRVGEESWQRLRRLRGSLGYWDRASVTKMGLYVTRIESAFISRALARRPPGLVADIGAGSGRLHAAILPYSRAVLATEIDREALARMRRDEGPVTPVLVAASQLSLPFRAEALDAVIAIEVPLASEEDWFPGECHRVLKPDGFVVLTVHNALSYKALISRALSVWRAARGVIGAQPYYRRTLTTQLQAWRSAGFRVKSLAGFYWLPLPRASDSTWVSVLAILERLLGLRWLVGWSPWVLLEFEKEPSIPAPNGKGESYQRASALGTEQPQVDE